MQGHQLSHGWIGARQPAVRIACPLFAVVAALPMACAETAETAGTGLKSLPYNHPGLTVDLGVGLWAWPIPYDVNHDGKPDLLVGAEDGRFYYYRNPRSRCGRP